MGDESVTGRRIRASLGLERNVLVLGATSAIGAFGNMLWWAFLPLFLQSEGLSAFEIGLIFSATTLTAASFQIPAGVITDRYGRKTSILLGGFIIASSIFLLAIAPSPTAAALAFLLFSVGGPISEVGRVALITESVPSEKLATSFGSWKTMAGSIAIAAPTMGGLVAASRGIREILLIGSALLFLMLILRAAFLKETLGLGVASKPQRGNEGPRFRSTLVGLKALLAERRLLMFALAYGIYNALLFQSSFVVPLYSRSVLGLSPLQIGLMYSVFVFFDASLAVFFGKLADHFGHTRTIIVSWMGEMALMMIFVYSVGPLPALISFSLWVAFGSMDGPALQALLGKLSKAERRGLSLGFLNTFALVLVIPSEVITGTLYSISDRLPFFANLGIDIVALVFFLCFLKMHNRS